MAKPTRGQLLSEGAYQHTRANEIIGRETWRFTKLGHGGLIIQANADFTAPQKYAWEATFEINLHYAPVALIVRWTEADAVKISEQRAEGNVWRARVGAETLELPFGKKHEVDFASPLFNTVTLLRSTLAVGQARELDVVFVEPATLIPRAVKQKYAAVAEEKISVPVGSFSAWRYELSYPDQAEAPTHTFWADAHGIVLKYDAGDEQTVLTHYRRVERR